MFLLGWLRSSAFRRVTLPTFIPPPGIRVMTRLLLAHHPFLPRDFHFLHVWKRRPSVPTVQREIWGQSVAYHRSEKWVSKFRFSLVSPNCVSILRSGRWGQEPLCRNGNVSFSLEMVRRSFLFGTKLLFVWVCYCPLQCYCYDHIIG
jgi:hypothetical protein